MTDQPAATLKDIDLLTAGRELLADPKNFAYHAQLEDLLRTLAGNLGEQELEQLLAESKDHPNYNALVDTLDQLAERTIVSLDGDGYEGVLLTVPLILVSDKPIRDLPPALVKKLVDGLHEYGLLMEGETASMQRWVNTAKGLLHNHVQRKRVLIGMMNERVVGRQPTPYRNTLPVELPEPGRDTVARFLTLTLHGPIGCAERVSLWSSPQMKSRLQDWMGEIARAMKNQGYTICSALLPCPYSMAPSKGATLVAQEQIRVFMTSTISKFVVPRPECIVRTRFTQSTDQRSLTLTMQYRHEDNELVRQVIEVPGLKGDDTIDVVVSLLQTHIARAVEAGRFLDAEFIHDTETSES